MAKASTGIAACLKVEDEANLAEAKPRYSKGFVRQARNAIVPVATIDESMRSGAPASFDWTHKGATSAVKDQEACGSCWAFSATEGVESGVFMVTGSLPPNLSTQQVVACDKTSGGCRGGDLPTAFAYIQGDGGIDSDASYPDTSHRFGITGHCKKHGDVAQITAYKYAVAPCQGGSCSSQDEDGLMAALHNFGPLSVCVNANTFNDYSGGIGINGEACSGAYNTLDHCVQPVGYDSTGDSPYWKVKNSWNTVWGEDGYIRLPMGSNYCGIADEAMYVQAELVSSDVAV